MKKAQIGSPSSAACFTSDRNIVNLLLESMRNVELRAEERCLHINSYIFGSGVVLNCQRSAIILTSLERAISSRLTKELSTTGKTRIVHFFPKSSTSNLEYLFLKMRCGWLKYQLSISTFLSKNRIITASHASSQCLNALDATSYRALKSVIFKAPTHINILYALWIFLFIFLEQHCFINVLLVHTGISVK